MKKLSELSDNTLIILGEDIPVITVDEISNYRDAIKNKKLKCYLAEKIKREVDNEYIDAVIDYLNDNLQVNDDLLEDDYLEATGEEKEKLYEIFNNMLSRTRDVYIATEEIKIDIL